MRRDVRLDDLRQRLLAPFPPLLAEVERLLRATVAEEPAPELHPPALNDPAAAKPITMAPDPRMTAVHGVEAPPPRRIAGPMQSAPLDNAASVATVDRNSAATLPAAAPGISRPDEAAAGSPATATIAASSRYSNRPAIRLAPRAAAAHSSQPATMPVGAGTQSPSATSTPSSSGSDASAAGTPLTAFGSAGMPAGRQLDKSASDGQRAMPVPPPYPPSAPTAPGAAPASGQSIPPILRPAQRAAARLTNGVEPVLERAYRVTQAALSPSAMEPPAAEKPLAQVHNTFNVVVALNPAEAAAGLDPEALREALVELLRAAARRQGLEV